MGFDLGLGWMVGLVIGFSLHEANHALAATLLGDSTPKKEGRLTLNPLRHLDPIGTIAILVAGFGWGKPVMVNPANFRVNPIAGMALVAVAGPLANIATALALAIPLRFSLGISRDFQELLFDMIIVNLVLAVFNMIPLAPLDGFSVLLGVLPRKLAMTLAPYARYGPPILLGLFALSYFSARGYFGLSIDPFGEILAPALRFLLPIVIG